MLAYPSRPGLKLFGIAALALFLAIPLAFVDALNDERQQRSVEARDDVARGWGQRQVLYAGFVEQPCKPVPAAPSAAAAFDTSTAPRDRCYASLAMPDTVTSETVLKPEMRQRGLFRVAVYTAETHVVARFAASDLATLPAGDGALERRIGFAITDPGGIRAVRDARLDGVPVRLEPGARPVFGATPLVATLPAEAGRDRDVTLEYRIELAGTDAHAMAPLARETESRMRGAWEAPSFDGDFLPVERTLADGGFDATWRVPSYSRSLPQVAPSDAFENVAVATFGVSFFDEHSVYRANDRATKYGLLVIALIYTALFLFERLTPVRLHPVQYALVGLALATFYLLLLAASEHVGFGPAYLLAACAAVAIVTGYAAASLRGWSRGATVGALQASAYGVFFVLVVNDTYALLLGAIVLLATLAAAMYLLRRVDWYAEAAPSAA